MLRARGACLAGLLAAACAAPPPPGALTPSLAPAAARGANLLLVTLDTTRPDHLGAYGAEFASTPNLDALATAGIRFTEAVTPVPVTLPAHASLLTGLEPPRHGLRWNGDRSRFPRPALAERFRAAGYGTAAFVSAFVLDRRFGLDAGFELYDDRVQGGAQALSGWTAERGAKATVDAALAWIAANSRRPWFVWIHLYDPHAPYLPPAPFSERFVDRPYDGEIAAVDHEVGRLLATVDGPEARRPTAVVVTADHGEGLGEHLEATHSIFLYDSTVRIPLLVRPPQRSAPAVVDTPVSLVDLAPTLLGWFDLPALPEVDGLDLSRVAPAADRALYLETRQVEHEHGWAPLYALRRATDKWIEAPRREYYDLATDRAESKNLFHEPLPPAAEPLARELARRLRDEPPEIEAETPRDREAEAKLAALGYLSAAAPGEGGSTERPDPKDRIASHALLLAVNAAGQAGNFDEADRLLDDAEARGQRERSLRLARAKLELRRNAPAAAEPVLRELLAERVDPEVDLPLAQILILDRRLEEARALLDRIAAEEPDYGALWIAEGDLLLQLGRPREALPMYRRAIEVDPYRAGGLAAQRAQRLEAALARSGR
jgi:arylsulfatase A-like enzyme/predicted negative regulator of RcsB-dependent stress response